MTSSAEPALTVPSILHIFPSFGIGGAQRRTVDLANTILADKRHVIVALDRDFSAASDLKADVRHRLVSLGFKRSSRPDLDNLRTFRRLVATYRPELLLTYNWGAIEAALANRIAPLCPHLHFEDGFGPDETPTRQLSRRVWARRLALSGKSTIVVPSKTLLDLAKTSWRFRSTRLRYIPNGIDCHRYSNPAADDPRQPLRQDPDEILIGAIGTLRPEKNVARLLRLVASVESVQPVRLVIVGDGPERENLEALASDLSIAERTLFVGHQRSPEEFLEQLDIFALTSDTEQMPYCLIEAMAAGRAVIATDVGDVKSMLPEANQAFVAAADDMPALTAQLKHLIEQPALRHRLGALNREHAQQHFDRESMLTQYIDLFKNLLPA
ncbi:MAG: glycosyltransferase family 4 protein [Geminicoccaceae bacterium]